MAATNFTDDVDGKNIDDLAEILDETISKLSEDMLKHVATMVKLKQEDIDSSNKRSLRRYIRSTYEAKLDDEEGEDSTKKAYVIQLLRGINVVNAA